MPSPKLKPIARGMLIVGLAVVVVGSAAYVFASGVVAGENRAAGPPSPGLALATLPPARPTALMTIDAISSPSPPSPTPAPTPTPTPQPGDYGPMTEAIERYLAEHVHPQGFDLGIGFVDVQSGQAVGVNGEARHYALSTFKGPLAAYYLWLVERGLLDEQPGDREVIEPMLNVSSNPDTTCVLERVGGLAPFNDWLAYQGLSRENNFVLSWQSWPCGEYVPNSDTRYSRGDDALGLPGGYVLLRCVPGNIRCDKAFAPLELAGLYARIARGEVLDAGHTALWLDWMEKSREGSAMLGGLPEDDAVHAYVKNGFRAADTLYDVHFFHEAGIIETGEGAFALAIFMQGNPDWPGTQTIADVARIVYDHFTGMHRPVAP